MPSHVLSIVRLSSADTESASVTADKQEEHVMPRRTAIFSAAGDEWRVKVRSGARRARRNGDRNGCAYEGCADSKDRPHFYLLACGVCGRYCMQPSRRTGALISRVSELAAPGNGLAYVWSPAGLPSGISSIHPVRRWSFLKLDDFLNESLRDPETVKGEAIPLQASRPAGDRTA